MKELFAVLRTRGPGWDPSHTLQDQLEWRAHAQFMDGLKATGFVLLGGPLQGTPDVLLIIRAVDEDEIRAVLAADPWTGMDLLRLVRVDRWSLRLGSLPGGADDPPGPHR